MEKTCGWCGKTKKVYAYKEVDYEEVQHLAINALLIDGKEPLREDDVVGVPICKECYEEIT